MSGLIIRWMTEDRRIGENVSSEYLEIELNADTLEESSERLPSLIKDLMVAFNAEKTAKDSEKTAVFSPMNGRECRRSSTAEL